MNEYLRKTITPKVLFDVSIDETADGNVITVGVPAGPDRLYVCDGEACIGMCVATRAADAYI